MEFPGPARRASGRRLSAALSQQEVQKSHKNRHSHTTGWRFQRVTAEQKIPGIKLQATGKDK
jgi:hypothetical protein